MSTDRIVALIGLTLAALVVVIAGWLILSLLVDAMEYVPTVAP